MGSINPDWIGAGISAATAGVLTARYARRYFKSRSTKVNDNESRWTVVFGAAAKTDSDGNVIAPARDGLVQRLLRLEGEFDTHTFHPPGEKGSPRSQDRGEQSGTR